MRAVFEAAPTDDVKKELQDFLNQLEEAGALKMKATVVHAGVETKPFYRNTFKVVVDFTTE